MDAQCAEIQALYALMSQYGVPIPEIDRANHATLESSFTSVKVGCQQHISVEHTTAACEICHLKHDQDCLKTQRSIDP